MRSRTVDALARRAGFTLLVAPLGAAFGASPVSDVWVGYRSAYVEALLDRRADADSFELLAMAEEFELAGRKDEARDLRDFVERRVWLDALGEPPVQAATIRDAATAKWPEHIWSLRKRGTERLLTVEPLAAWLDGDAAPSFDRPADDGYTSGSRTERTLDARFRVTYAPITNPRTTNPGITDSPARPVVAFELLLGVPFGDNGAQRFSCRWHDHEPLPPGQSRDVACRWTMAEPEALRARDGLVAPRGADSLEPALAGVAFLEAGRRVPYALDNNFSVGGDLDLARLAVERARSATCSQRDSCSFEFDVLGLSLDLLPWLVAPSLLGALLGRFARRREAR